MITETPKKTPKNIQKNIPKEMSGETRGETQGEIPSAEKILKKIRIFENGEQRRLNALYEQSIGKHKILEAVKKEGKPNNKIVSNFAQKIVNDTVGYYLGVPVKYTSEDTLLAEKIDHITEYNDDAAHNTEIGEDLSTFGTAAEIIYYDDDEEIRYKKINPMFLYVHRTDDLEREVDYAARWYDVFDDDFNRTRYIEVYNDREIVYMTQAQGYGTPVITAKKPHYFGLVPVNVFQNNKDSRGDFEGIISLNDAYNTMQSETVNDYQSFADAILFTRGIFWDSKSDDLLRDKDVLQSDDAEGDAQWLVKNVNDAYVENAKNRLERDMYRLSATVDMSDENFGNNLSGVAIKYKLMSMENRVAKTERYFKKALCRRFEMICNLLNLKGGRFNFSDIDIKFTRNIPVSAAEEAQTAQQLSGIISKETQIGLLSFISDPKEEAQKLLDEQGSYPSAFLPGESRENSIDGFEDSDIAESAENPNNAENAENADIGDGENGDDEKQKKGGKDKKDKKGKKDNKKEENSRGGAEKKDR